MVGIVQNKSGLICVQQLLRNFAAALLSFYRFALWAHRITLTLCMHSHGRNVFCMKAISDLVVATLGTIATTMTAA